MAVTAVETCALTLPIPTSDKDCLCAALRHLGLNSLFIFVVLPIQIAVSILTITISTWAASSEWGLFQQLHVPGHVWLEFFLMLVVLDFLDYVYHSTRHRVPALWRFHLVHHSDLTVDVSTTVREHPDETLLRNIYLVSCVLLTGAPAEIQVMRQMAQSFFNLSSHAASNLPPLLARILAWLEITPNLHHVHHYSRLPLTNRNYGDVFSIWDRLFGTLAQTGGHTLNYGIDTHTRYLRGASFLQTLWLPFLQGQNLDPIGPEIRSATSVKVEAATARAPAASRAHAVSPRLVKDVVELAHDSNIHSPVS